MNIKSTVFLSSTWKDLEEHRKIIINSFQKLKFNIEVMELFGALPATPLKESLERVKSSDIFVGILGTRYGTIDPSTMKSITELEYLKAREFNKPIYMYVIDEENHPVLPCYVEKGDSAIALHKFKEIATLKHKVEKFSSPDNLSRLIIEDITNLFLKKENYFEEISNNKSNEIDIDRQISLRMSDFTSNSNLNFYSLFSIKDDNSKQIKDEVIESAMIAGVLARELKNKNYDILQGVISFRPEVLRVLLVLLNKNDIDQDSLSNEILFCKNSFQLRLLIYLAGELSAEACVNSICMRLIGGRRDHVIIIKSKFQIRSFNEIIKVALGSMPISTQNVLKKYLNLAKESKNWHAKRTLEGAIKLQCKR